MFEYQIRSMRKTIDRHLKSEYPPQKVGIKLTHAEYLGVSHVGAPPVNEVRPSGLSNGVMYGSVVLVDLQELYLALRSKHGVDYETETPDIQAGEASDSDKDHSQAS